MSDLIDCPALDGPVVPLGVEAELEQTGGPAHTELGGREVYELLQLSTFGLHKTAIISIFREIWGNLR